WQFLLLALPGTVVTVESYSLTLREGQELLRDKKDEFLERDAPPRAVRAPSALVRCELRSVLEGVVVLSRKEGIEKAESPKDRESSRRLSRSARSLEFPHCIPGPNGQAHP